MTYRNLKIFDSNGFDTIYNHRKHLCICFCTAITYIFYATLCSFFKSPLIIRCICKCISHIAKLYRLLFWLEILCHTSCNRWSKVRTKHYGISFCIKELKQVFRRCSSYLVTKYIKVFKGRCLNVQTAVFCEYLMEFIL